MTLLQIKADFIKFLKCNRCYKKFNTNLLSKGIYNNIESLVEDASKSKTQRTGGIIEGAFLWSDTKEGHKFWMDISEMWNNHCISNNIKFTV